MNDPDTAPTFKKTYSGYVKFRRTSVRMRDVFLRVCIN